MFGPRMVVAAALIAACSPGALGAGKDAQAQVLSWIVPAAAGDPSPTLLPVRIPAASARRTFSSALAAGPIAPTPPATLRQAAYRATVTLPSGGTCRVSLTLNRSRLSPETAGALHAVLRITNTGEATVSYAESGMGCAWQVVGRDGHVLYDSLRGRVIPHFMLVRHLDPGKSESFAADIPLRDEAGAPLPPGNYRLRARLAIGTNIAAEAPFAVTGH